jgi:Na+-driven multidrug efflux pump
MSDRFDPINGPVVPVFFHYAVPSVLGMLALTSAGIIDGIFVGNFVGSAGLAAINLTLPVFAFLVAVVIMVAVGGSVMCGKYIGERNPEAASMIFSKTIYATLAAALPFAGLSLLFLDQLVILLGANEELAPMVALYLRIFMYAIPLLMLGFAMDYFVRLDGRPILASAALVAVGAINIVLDWLFIVRWGWGLAGAAWATALAYTGVFFILLSHWFSRRCTLRLVRVPNRWRDGWDAVARASFNGFSEFANEISIGLVTLLFNWVMITRLGVDGVAAFTIIGYLLMIGLEVCYGVSESLQPTVSKNLGARQPRRIVQFTTIAVACTLGVGLVSSALFLLIPETLTSIFLADGETGTRIIALAFIGVFWPTFLFNGSNITLAAYFTAMHKPIQSAMIALSRSLVFPAAGVLLLPLWLGDTGVYVAIPFAEFVTFVLALLLVRHHTPARVIESGITEPPQGP